MSHLEKFLREAFPHVDPDLAAAAVSEILGDPGRKIAALEEELAECRELEGILRREVARLNAELGSHKEGIATASRAGLDVLGERARQRRMEGYDDEHDDGFSDFSLSAAAIAYAVDARLRGTTGRGFDNEPPVEWPWMPIEWKPKDIRRSLVVAAALLIAEIERLDRTVSPAASA